MAPPTLRAALAVTVTLLVGAEAAGGGADLAGASLHGGIADRISKLPFVATRPPKHKMTIGTGVFFEHLFDVDPTEHIFKADFWLVTRWQDPRDYSALFEDNPDIEVEERTCVAAGEPSHEHHLQLASNTSDPHVALAGRRFLELGHGAIDLLWHPDIHIRNEASPPKKHAELTRLYEDGTVEEMVFMYCDLEILDPYYGPFPFDHLDLTVQVESLAHTTKQIELEALDSFSGVEYALTKSWPGWDTSPDGVHFQVDAVRPDYTHTPGNAHRCETRSRYHLDIHVQRATDTVRKLLIPLFIQVGITWTAFYVNIKVLMPRVAVAFISYLTLSNTANSLTASLPDASYQIWFGLFIFTQQLMVVASLLETIANVYITARISSRVGQALDRFTQIMMPVDYILFNTILIAVGSTEMERDAYDDALHSLETGLYVNLVALVTAAALWCLYTYRKLYHAMCRDPVGLHTASYKTPMDVNEVEMMFSALDKNHNGLLEIHELVTMCLSKSMELTNGTDNASGSESVPEEMVEAVVKTLSKKPAFRMAINPEMFSMNYQPIMAELSLISYKTACERRALDSVSFSGSRSFSRSFSLGQGPFPRASVELGKPKDMEKAVENQQQQQGSEEEEEEPALGHTEDPEEGPQELGGMRSFAL